MQAYIKKDPTLIDYDYFGAISDKDRKFPQKVAKTTVEEYFNINSALIKLL